MASTTAVDTKDTATLTPTSSKEQEEKINIKDEMYLMLDRLDLGERYGAHVYKAEEISPSRLKLPLSAGIVDVASLLYSSEPWLEDPSLIIKQLEDLSGGKLTISSEKLRDTNDIVKAFKKNKIQKDEHQKIKEYGEKINNDTRNKKE